jgi:heptosyltransferase-2
MTLPALEAVRECFPNCTISVLAKPWVIPLFESHPMVDEVISLDSRNGLLAGLLETIKISQVIRHKGFDMAILFQNAFEAALIAYLSSIKRRVGFNTDHRGFLLSHPINRKYEKKGNHQVEYYLSILRNIDCKGESKDPVLFLSDEYKEKSRTILSNEGVQEEDILLGLSPGAIFGSAKRWPPDRFAGIGDRAAEKWGAKLVILGSNREIDICTEVSNRMMCPSINLSGKTDLGEAMGVIKRCDLFLSNDSGLMHMAAALKVPLVAVFGSTDPVATGPRGPTSVVVRHKVDCAPCLKPDCNTDFRCMLDIKQEEVWDRLEELRKKYN